MKKILFLFFMTTALLSCQESIEDRAAREAKIYTEKYCPTPIENYTRTDSVAFIKETRTYTYYCSFVDKMDDEKVVAEVKQKLNGMLIEQLKNSTSVKQLKEAGFNFSYIVRSDKTPQKILYKIVIQEKDYR